MVKSMRHLYGMPKRAADLPTYGSPQDAQIGSYSANGILSDGDVTQWIDIPHPTSYFGRLNRNYEAATGIDPMDGHAPTEALKQAMPYHTNDYVPVSNIAVKSTRESLSNDFASRWYPYGSGPWKTLQNMYERAGRTVNLPSYLRTGDVPSDLHYDETPEEAILLNSMPDGGSGARALRSAVSSNYAQGANKTASMRHLYGMPKRASQRREEFISNLRNYFGSLRFDGRKPTVRVL